MSDVFPHIAAYTGNLTTGVPVVINPQQDHGWVTDFLAIGAIGSQGCQLSFGNTTLPIPAGILVSLPGPLPDFTITGNTGNGYFLYCSQGVGQLPQLTIASGGGGGGGGGAPTNAPYLLNGTDGTLTNAVNVQNLPGTLLFIKDDSGSFAGSVSKPISSEANFGGAALLPNGGVGMDFMVVDGSGSHTFGALEWRLDSTSSKSELHVLGLTGATLAVITPTVVGGTGGITLSSASRMGLTVEGGGDAVLKSNTGKLQFDVGANNLATMDGTSGLTFHFPTWSYINADHQLAVMSGGHNEDASFGQDHGSEIRFGDQFTDDYVFSNSKGFAIRSTNPGVGGWTFKANGELHGSGTLDGQIKNLVDGTTDDAAVTLYQLNTKADGTAFGNIVYGATSTGGPSAVAPLYVGGAFAATPSPAIARCLWVAPHYGTIPTGRLICSAPPIVGGVDTHQNFTVYKNGVATGLFLNLTGSKQDRVDCTVGTATAGDFVTLFIGANTYGPYTVGVLDTDADVATAIAALAVADPDYTVTAAGPVVTCIAIIAGPAPAVISTTATGTTTFTAAHTTTGMYGDLNGIFAGAPVGFIAGDFIAIMATNHADALDVGATDVMITLGYSNI